MVLIQRISSQENLPLRDYVGRSKKKISLLVDERAKRILQERKIRIYGAVATIEQEVQRIPEAMARAEKEAATADHPPPKPTKWPTKWPPKPTSKPPKPGGGRNHLPPGEEMAGNRPGRSPSMLTPAEHKQLEHIIRRQVHKEMKINDYSPVDKRRKAELVVKRRVAELIARGQAKDVLGGKR